MEINLVVKCKTNSIPGLLWILTVMHSAHKTEGNISNLTFMASLAWPICRADWMLVFQTLCTNSQTYHYHYLENIWLMMPCQPPHAWRCSPCGSQQDLANGEGKCAQKVDSLLVQWTQLIDQDAVCVDCYFLASFTKSLSRKCSEHLHLTRGAGVQPPYM